MNVAELERILSDAEYIQGDAVLPAYMVRYLARRVIAAEKLVDALRELDKDGDCIIAHAALTAYETTK